MRVLSLFLLVAFFKIDIQFKNEEEKFFDIINKAILRIGVNYDTTMMMINDYNEFVYNNKTNELISAVNINGFINKNASKPDQKENYNLIKSEIYEKSKSYGYTTLFQKHFGGNSLLNNETNIIFTLLLITKYGIDNIENDPPPCCPRASISTVIKQKKYEVKDSIYNSINCFSLKVKGEKLFFFNKKRFLNSNIIQNKSETFEKNLIGSWDSSSVNYLREFIIDKSNYAILGYRISQNFISRAGESFTIEFQNKFEKIGKYYYESYFECIMPRFEQDSCGFNSRNLYTYSVKTLAPVLNANELFKEIDFYKLKTLPQKPYEQFCIKRQYLDSKLEKTWNDFTHKKSILCK